MNAIPQDASSDLPSERLRRYRRIAILTQGYSQPFYAKTAMSLLKYRRSDVLAVIDAQQPGKDASELFGMGHGVPVAASLETVSPDALFLGIAIPGGRIPDAWRTIITGALKRGIDVVSGMHEFLSEDPEFSRLADQHECRLIDVRKNHERSTSTGEPFRKECLRILTVGQDCTVGKMVASVEVQRELSRSDVDAHFVATGQTGIMISGDGVPVDCVVSDFVNGAVENLVRRNQHHDVLLIEGQGSISHPSFSAVTLGLLHGSLPDGLIYCYEVGRRNVKGLDGVPLRSHRQMIDVYLTSAALRHPCRLIGIAMNSRNVSPSEAELERESVAQEFGVPVCDVYRHGAAELADAVTALSKQRSRDTRSAETGMEGMSE